MSRVVHFEIPSDNPERAAAFYGEIFGWNFQKWDGPMPYWLVKTGADGEPGINGGLKARSHPGESTVNTVSVASVDESLLAIERKGGKVVAPKMPIPSIGWLAYCTDPDGNAFGVLQPDSAAK